MTLVNVAREFSPYLGGRFRRHGEFSGEDFRERFLVPRLREQTAVRVVFDGVFGLPSSFLEEAFGGLVRGGQIQSFEQFRRLIKVEATQPSISNAPSLVERYVRDALMH